MGRGVDYHFGQAPISDCKAMSDAIGAVDSALTARDHGGFEAGAQKIEMAAIAMKLGQKALDFPDPRAKLAGAAMMAIGAGLTSWGASQIGLSTAGQLGDLANALSGQDNDTSPLKSESPLAPGYDAHAEAGKAAVGMAVDAAVTAGSAAAGSRTTGLPNVSARVRAMRSAIDIGCTSATPSQVEMPLRFDYLGKMSADPAGQHQLPGRNTKPDSNKRSTLNFGWQGRAKEAHDADDSNSDDDVGPGDGPNTHE